MLAEWQSWKAAVLQTLCVLDTPPPLPLFGLIANWSDIIFYVLNLGYKRVLVEQNWFYDQKRPVQRCFQATLPPQEASATILHAESKNHSKVWIKDSTFSIVFHQSNKVLLWNCSKVPWMWVWFQPEKAVPGSASGKSRRSHGIFVKHSWGS